MVRIPRHLILLPGLLAIAPLARAAAPTDASSLPAQASSAEGVRAILNNGNPELAIQSARALLTNKRLKNAERRRLLELIARGEEMRAAWRDYSDVRQALAAWKSLLKEFPDDPHAADMRWHIAWLLWKQGELLDARKAAETLVEHHPASPQARMARLLMARVAIERNHLRKARKHLLQYMIDVADKSEDAARGLAWLAVVDAREHRIQAALAGMEKARRIQPELVEEQPQLLAAYVRLLHATGQTARARLEAERFLKRFIDTRYAPPIRLLHADILAAAGERKRALTEYDQLAEAEAETTIGKQALMRKLMLKYADVRDFERLKPPLIALEKLANGNQLTVIEAEALLDQARLWHRLIGKRPHAADQALMRYARAADAHFDPWSARARERGARLLQSELARLIAQKAGAQADEGGKPEANGRHDTARDQSRERWLQVIVLWKRYPALRAQMLNAAGRTPALVDIRIGVARALRMLMQFDAAERMLARLQREDPESIQGQRVMLERARLWLDRGDKDGVAKIMRWLDTHEFTIFRPDMLLIAAIMRLNAGQVNAASQTLRAIAPEDLAPESRPAYWRASARANEALSRWHLAARAWMKHAKLAHQADSLKHAGIAFRKAEEFAEAERAFLAVPKDARDAEWEYRMAEVEFRTGKWKQAEERLQRLVADDSAGAWRDMARLALADRRAQALLERQ